jgi:hypothetical protein
MKSEKFIYRWILLGDASIQTASKLKNAVFLDMAPCRSCVNRCFGGTYRLHLQFRKIREQGTSVSRCLQTAECSRWFLTRGFCNPEDGGDRFLRNIGSHKIYTAPYPRRRYYSQSPLWKPQILYSFNAVLRISFVALRHSAHVLWHEDSVKSVEKCSMLREGLRTWLQQTHPKNL